MAAICEESILGTRNPFEVLATSNIALGSGNAPELFIETLFCAETLNIEVTVKEKAISKLQNVDLLNIDVYLFIVMDF